MKDYFSAFDDFAQVYFYVSKGIEISESEIASSVSFDATKMFYGSAFEIFSSSVDILAYLNNIHCGRRFDEFEHLSRKQYLELDKSSRFNTFKENPQFYALCEEADNQIRNASHHNSFNIDVGSQIITYRSGKGGTGPERNMSYSNYLVRCNKIFLQTIVLLRLELILTHAHEKSPPL
jgi:hypothetical protein